MSHYDYPLRLVAAALLAASPVAAKPQSPVGSTTLEDTGPALDTADYVRLARWADSAPMVADVTVRKALPVDRKAQIAGERFYAEAETNALIRGRDALAERVAFLAEPRGDLPLKALRKRRLLVFARPVSGRPGEIQLITPDAYLEWTPERDAGVRGFLRELLAPKAAPPITAITSAFYVPGTVTGEGETQFFLATATGHPASLFVRRDAAGTVSWGAAFGEVVEQSAAQPQARTLAWYRLACGLPQTLPASAFADAHDDRRMEVERDYRYVLEQLGACPS